MVEARVRVSHDLDGVPMIVIVAARPSPRVRVRKHRRLGDWGFECGSCHVMENTAHGWRFALALAHIHLLESLAHIEVVPEQRRILEGESCG